MKSVNIEIVALSSFHQAVKKWLDAEDIKRLADMLRNFPEQGAVIKGTGGVRKMRLALKGQGKSGGARVIYFYLVLNHQIFLITAYKKNQKENLSDKEIQTLKQLTDRLKAV